MKKAYNYDERKLRWRMDGRRMDDDHWGACLFCDRSSSGLARDAFTKEQTSDPSILSTAATTSVSDEWARLSAPTSTINRGVLRR